MKMRQRNIHIKYLFAFTIVLLLLGSTVPAMAQAPSISFSADRRVIKAGECVTISWNATGVNQVYYNGAPVTGENQTRSECPGQTKTYYLEVLQNNGQVVTIPLTVYVQGGTPVPVIRFWADRTSIKRGECVNISWHVENVKEVYYRGRPVVGENQNRVECPKRTKIYDLITIKTDGNPHLSTITVNVSR
jgi:hypothetical protein